MRLSIRRYLVLQVALFTGSALIAFLFFRLPQAPPETAAAAPAPLETSAEPPPAAPFEATADRVTLGSGIEPDARVGALENLQTELRRLAALPDGEEKLQLAQSIGDLRDPTAIPLLLDWATMTTDRALLRSALDALGPVATAETIADVQQRYTAAFRYDDRYRLAKVLRNISNPEAAPALIALAENADAPPELVVAATESLATIGTPEALACLLGKLQAADPDDTGRLKTAIARIEQPAALAALRFAALGNKDAPTDTTRAAAAQALANFRDEETLAVLEQLSADPSAIVSAAALGALERKR
jgi:HEAT repeat protein